MAGETVSALSGAEGAGGSFPPAVDRGAQTALHGLRKPSEATGRPWAGAPVPPPTPLTVAPRPLHHSSSGDVRMEADCARLAALSPPCNALRLAPSHPQSTPHGARRSSSTRTATSGAGGGRGGRGETDRRAEERPWKTGGVPSRSISARVSARGSHQNERLRQLHDDRQPPNAAGGRHQQRLLRNAPPQAAPRRLAPDQRQEVRRPAALLFAPKPRSAAATKRRRAWQGRLAPRGQREQRGRSSRGMQRTGR